MHELEVLDLPNEVWRPIESTNGYYEVSNLGRIKSTARTVTTKRGVRHYPSIILKLTLYGKYLTATPQVLRARFLFRVHRAVAVAFIPNPENKPHVNHKDSNKLNNSVENLEWCTHLENMRHAHSNGACTYSSCTGRKGEKHPFCKLSDAQVREAVSLYRNRKISGESALDIAKRFGINLFTLYKYASGSKRKEVTNGL